MYSLCAVGCTQIKSVDYIYTLSRFVLRPKVDKCYGLSHSYYVHRPGPQRNLIGLTEIASRPEIHGPLICSKMRLRPSTHGAEGRGRTLEQISGP